MKKKEDVNRSEIEDIYFELSQCREDERSCKNQIFQLLAVLATFLTVLTALISFGVGNNYSEFYSIAAYALGIMVICVMAGSISNIGLLNAFRHHYVIKLETRISELLNCKDKIPNWEHVSSPLVTLNIKHTTVGLMSIYSINNYTTFLLVPILAITYVVLNFVIIHKSLITFGLLGIFSLAMLFFVITVLIAMQKSKEIFNMSYEKSKERYEQEKWGRFGKTKNKSIKQYLKAILYYVYPRPKDMQKIFFIVVGFIMGYVGKDFIYNQRNTFDLPLMLFAIVLFDILIYQVRYQWNDLRGLEEDVNHEEREARCRLPIYIINEKCAIIISVITMAIKFILAVFLVNEYGDKVKFQIWIGILLILLVALLYELARSQKRIYLTFALVCLGYPVRIVCGLCIAWPNMLGDLCKDLKILLCYTLILIATAAFGETFVSLTWAHEIAKVKISSKVHLMKLIDQIGGENFNKRYPLRKKGEIKTVWNICHVISIATLCIAYIICQPSKFVVLGMVAVFILAIIAVFVNERRLYLIFPNIFILFMCFFYSYKVNRETIFIILIVSILHIIYFITYLLFRHMNYIELYGALENLFLLILIILSKIKECGWIVFKFVFGEQAYRVLKKQDKTKLINNAINSKK